MELAKRLKDSLDYSGEIIPSDEIIEHSDAIRDKVVLLCDDTVLTGDSLLRNQYTLEHMGARDVFSVVLAVRNSAKIIPNIYAFELNKNDSLILPWNSCPIRTYLGGTLSNFTPEDSNRTFGDSAYICIGGILSLCRKEKIGGYRQRAYGLTRDKMLKGVARFWESKEEIVVEDIKCITHKTNEEKKEILETLWKSLINTAYFHGKEKLVAVTPKDNAKKIRKIVPQFEFKGECKDKKGGILFELQLTPDRTNFNN